MASSVAGERLTEAHRLVQARVAARTLVQMRQAWPLLDLTNLDATTDRWLEVALKIARSQNNASANLAAQYMKVHRSLELGTRPSFVPELATLTDEAFLTSMRVTGPVKVKSSPAPLLEASQAAFTASTNAATRHVLNGGRDTIYNGRQDRALLGVARRVSLRPCSFCAMLAARGPVYFSESTAAFKAHDDCKCVPEPIYRTDTAWPPRSREFAELWAKSTQGYSGKGAVNAFRRAYTP